ncbi:MAG: hypothetical protein WCP99_06115 [Burkholderiales bacterium]
MLDTVIDTVIDTMIDTMIDRPIDRCTSIRMPDALGHFSCAPKAEYWRACGQWCEIADT